MAVKPVIPAGAETFESEIAVLWLGADGILYSSSKSPRRTVENISANIALVKRITGGRKMPLLVYLTPSPVPDKQTRDFVAKELPNTYSAMAMISGSGLGAVIMNFIFGLKPPAIPMKSFSDVEKAKAWLRDYL